VWQLRTLSEMRDYLRTEWEKLRQLGVWTSIFLLLGITFSMVLIFPILYGSFSIVFGDKSTPSSSESFGLALVSAALGGIIFWLVRPPVATDESGAVKSRPFKVDAMNEFTGLLFLLSALSFTLFGLLAPFLDIVVEGTSFFPSTMVGAFAEGVTKYTSVVAMILGSIALAMATCWGSFLVIWKIAAGSKSNGSST
jgi:hypothetical protein